jgi:hypothetical protein
MVIALVVLASANGFDWFNDRLEDQFEQISATLSETSEDGATEDLPADDGGGGEEDPDPDSDPDPEPEPEPEPIDDSAAHDVALSDTSNGLEWWNAKWYGGYGEWEAEFTFANDWSEDQVLTMDVTVSNSNGSSDTTTVQVFVPADSTATHSVGDLWIQHVRWRGTSGDEEVSITVTSIATIDGTGAPVSYDTDGPSATVTPPAVD